MKNFLRIAALSTVAAFVLSTGCTANRSEVAGKELNVKACSGEKACAEGKACSKAEKCCSNDKAKSECSDKDKSECTDKAKSECTEKAMSESKAKTCSEGAKSCEAKKSVN